MSDSKNISLQSAEVVAIKLTNASRTHVDLDIRALVHNVEIFEDIDYPLIRAQITLLDSINLINTIPIKGEEVVEIEFRSLHIDTLSKYKFAIYSMNGIQTFGLNNGIVYTLNGVSVEFINNGYRIDRHYKDISNAIVENILTNDLETSKPIYNRSLAQGLQDIVIPNLSPFAAIDFIRQRSVDNLTPFLFYENREGFNFKSLRHLINNYEDIDKDILINPYVYTAQQLTQDKDGQRYFGLLNLEYISRFNTAAQISSGGFASTTNSFDLKTKEKNKTRILNDQGYSTNFSSNQNKQNKSYYSYFMAKDSSKPNDFRIENNDKIKMNLIKFNQFVVRCVMYGNNLLSVGRFIKIQAPGWDLNRSDNKDIDSPFIITKLRHSLKLYPHTEYTVTTDCHKLVKL
jgi:hypothetical protein